MSQGKVSEAEGRLAAAEAQLAQAEAAYAQAKWDREAFARLFQRGLIAEQEARRAQSTEEAQAAVVSAARRQVEAARGSLDGREGESLQPGDSRLAGGRGAGTDSPGAGGHRRRAGRTPSALAPC